MRFRHCVALGGLLLTACYENRNKSIELMNQGVENARQKLYDSAIRNLKMSTETDPTNHLAWYNLGKVFEDSKKWDEAAKAFSEATKIEDGNADYHYELGQSYQEAGKLELAKGEYQACVKIDDRRFKAHYRLGTVLQDLKLFREADAAYRKAIETNPRFPNSFLKLGYLYLDNDYDKEAVKVFQGAVMANDSDGELHLGLAEALQKDNQLNDATKEYVKALERNGELFQAVYNLGMTYKALDDKKNAKLWFQRYIDNAGSKGTPETLKAAKDSMYQLDAP